jgi:hypothetical protein
MCTVLYSAGAGSVQTLDKKKKNKTNQVRGFMAGVTLLVLLLTRPPEKWLGWEEACRHVRSFDHPRLEGAPRLIALIDGGGARAKVAVQRGAARLRSDLAARNVLCDHAQPCSVTVSGGDAEDLAVSVCVPPGAPALGSRLCDPWGLDFQQEGGVLEQTRRATTRPPRTNSLGGSSQAERLSSGLANGETCVSVNLTQLARWWARHRTRRPFLSTSDGRLAQHLEAKSHSARHAQQPTPTQVHMLFALLNRSSSPTSLQQAKAASSAQSLRRCAFVGSGHDLRCGTPRGAEIDSSYDAVFRANAAQQLDHPHRHFISPERAGTQTDFRANCLFNSSLLPSSKHESVCIIPRGWWRSPWGKETSNNAKNMCCVDWHKMRSLYSIENLAALSESAANARGQGPVFAWLDPDSVTGAGEAVENMMHSTGGNAMVAATALCDSVDVFGAGLFGTDPASQKVYTHYYDESVSKCVVDAHSKTVKRWMLTHSWAFKWLKQRLADELTMHVLHSFDIVRWRT